MLKFYYWKLADLIKDNDSDKTNQYSARINEKQFGIMIIKYYVHVSV